MGNKDRRSLQRIWAFQSRLLPNGAKEARKLIRKIALGVVILFLTTSISSGVRYSRIAPPDAGEGITKGDVLIINADHVPLWPTNILGTEVSAYLNIGQLVTANGEVVMASRNTNGRDIVHVRVDGTYFTGWVDHRFLTPLLNPQATPVGIP